MPEGYVFSSLHRAVAVALADYEHRLVSLGGRSNRRGSTVTNNQLAVLGYQHMTLKEPSLMGLNWYSEESLSHR